MYNPYGTQNAKLFAFFVTMKNICTFFLNVALTICSTMMTQMMANFHLFHTIHRKTCKQYLQCQAHKTQSLNVEIE